MKRFYLNTAAFLVMVIVSPLSASAQAREVRMSLLAFNDDLSQYLARVDNENQGTSIQIREVPTNKIKKVYYVDDKAQERKRVKRLKRKKFKTEGHIDQVGPKGRHTVMGAPDGHRSYDIMIMRNQKLGILGKIPLKRDESGKVYAKAMLKEVMWTPNGKQLLVVVNQKIERPDGLEDVDEVHFMRFRPWKVRWLNPPPVTEEQNDNEKK